MGQRLIDANKLVLRFEYGIQADGLLFVPFRDMQKSVKRAPTVDAVPIVRCRECKYNIGHGEADYCIRMDIFFRCHPEFFCGYGERKGNHG